MDPAGKAVSSQAHSNLVRPHGALAPTLLYLASVFGGGALLSPWIYWGVQGLHPQSGILHLIAQYPVQRFATRCIELLAVLFLWPYLRALGVRNLSDAGLRSRARNGAREIGAGFGIGTAAILVFGLLALLIGGRAMRPHSGAEWLLHFRNAALAGVAVGFLEELVFRGAVFTAFRRGNSFALAALASSAIYALVHFLGRAEEPPRVEWYSGLTALAQMLDGFTHFASFVPAFFNLFIIGLILALAVERTGAIFFGIGFHAALIFTSKTVRFASDVSPGANLWFWGTNKVVDGWFAFLFLLAIYTLLWKQKGFFGRGSPPLPGIPAK